MSITSNPGNISSKEQPAGLQDVAGGEPEGPDLEDGGSNYDDKLMKPEVVMQAYAMVINNSSDNDIQADIKELCGVTPPEDWLKDVRDKVDETKEQVGVT